MQIHAQPAPGPPPIGTNLLQRKCSCGGAPGPSGECSECRSKRLTLQRSAMRHSGLSSVPYLVHEVLRSSGQMLDPTTRSFMEPRFGHDFGGARGREGCRVGRSRERAGLRSRTACRVRSGAVRTGYRRGATAAGARARAHVVQQGRPGESAAAQADLEVSDARGTAEREAETLADRVLAAGEGRAGGHAPPLSG